MANGNGGISNEHLLRFVSALCIVSCGISGWTINRVLGSEGQAVVLSSKVKENAIRAEVNTALLTRLDNDQRTSEKIEAAYEIRLRNLETCCHEARMFKGTP
jgi:hypothetical protein